MSRLIDAYARRAAEAAATMPSFAVSRSCSPAAPGALLGAVVSALKEGAHVAWRDGAVVDLGEPRVAVALPGPVFPVLGDYATLAARDPESFTAAEQAGATFTVWGLGLDVDWFTPLLLPRQGAALGVGRAGLTLACDARAVTPAAAAAWLAQCG